MGQSGYWVVTDGSILEGFERSAVMKKFELALKLQNKPELLKRMFSGRRVILKKGLTEEQAKTFVTKLQSQGLRGLVLEAKPKVKKAEQKVEVPLLTKKVEPPEPVVSPLEQQSSDEVPNKVRKLLSIPMLVPTLSAGVLLVCVAGLWMWLGEENPGTIAEQERIVANNEELIRERQVSNSTSQDSGRAEVGGIQLGASSDLVGNTNSATERAVIKAETSNVPSQVNRNQPEMQGTSIIAAPTSPLAAGGEVKLKSNNPQIGQNSTAGEVMSSVSQKNHFGSSAGDVQSARVEEGAVSTVADSKSAANQRLTGSKGAETAQEHASSNRSSATMQKGHSLVSSQTMRGNVSSAIAAGVKSSADAVVADKAHAAQQKEAKPVIGKKFEVLAKNEIVKSTASIENQFIAYDPSKEEKAQAKNKAPFLKAAEEPFSPELQDKLKDGGVGPLMVVVPTGSFIMGDILGGGDETELPLRKVTIGRPFAIGMYEVTFEEYDRFVRMTDRSFPKDKNWGRDNRPVINVNWNDAKAYVKWLSKQTGKKYRLPTEAEWEYVARAGNQTRYTWGDELGINNANCKGCGSLWDNAQTAPVGKFKANGFGLYDLQGNVREWVEDCFYEEYGATHLDGSARLIGNCRMRGARGGSWRGTEDTLRTAKRRWSPIRFRSDMIGIRVVRDLID